MQPRKVFVDPLLAARFVSRVEAAIAAKNVMVETSADFEALNRVCEETEGKDPTSEPFSRHYFDILPEDGLWIRGFDSTGETVHVQALRRDRLDGVTLAELLERQLWRIHVDRNEGAALGPIMAPGAHRITGTCVYHGEMWVAPQFRAKGVAGLLSRLALGLALLTWKPDYVWGFVASNLVHYGYPITEGYVHMEPEGVSWVEPPPGIRRDDWLVWMGLDDLVHLALRPPEVPAQASSRTPSGN